MYVKASFKCDADASVAVLDFDPLNLNGEFSLNPYARGSLGAGVDKILSVEGWIGGGGKFEFQYPIKPNLKDITFYFNGGVSIYAFLWKWEKELLRWDWQMRKGNSASDALDFTPATEPKVVSRDYLRKSDSGRFFSLAQPALICASADGQLYSIEGATVQSSTFPYSEPFLSACSDRVGLTWVQDNAARSSMNRTMAVYSSYDGASWSAQKTIDENGTADFHPQNLIFSGGSAIAAWEDGKNALSDNSTFEDMVKNMEIAVSNYNPLTQTWAAARRLTTNEHLDRSPVLSGNALSSTMLAWVENEQNDIRGSGTALNKIWYSVFDGTNWTAPVLAAQIPFGLIKYSLAFNGTTGYLVYSLDLDNDPGTASDHELFSMIYNGGSWSSMTRLTEDVFPDDNPNLAFSPDGKLLLVWIKGDEISYVSDLDMSKRGIIFASEYSTNLADFRLATSMSGRMALIWADPSNYNSDVFVIFYDPALKTWGGAPKQLTFDAETERYLTAAFLGGNTLVAVYDRNLIGENTLTRNAANVEAVQIVVPSIQNTDLYTLKYSTGRDLSLNSSSFFAAPPNAEPGMAVAFSVTANNIGDEAVLNIPVHFYAGNPTSGGTKIGESVIPGNFMPGNSADVTCEWEIPQTSQMLQIYAVIDPAGIFDGANRSNNTASIEIVKPDLKISNVRWGKRQNNQIEVTARVSNDGALPSGTTEVRFRKGAKTGALLSELNIGVLTRGEIWDVNFFWDVSGVNLQDRIIYIAVDETNKVPEFNEDNNSRTITLTEDLAISLSKTSLFYGAQLNGAKTNSQVVIVSNSGSSTLNWTAQNENAWISVSPASGTGNAVIQIGADPAGLAVGTYQGTVSISDPGATNSPQTIAITLIVYAAGTNAPPFGSFDTPADGTTGVTGAIPVTGWVVDDVEVTRVEILRDNVSGETPGQWAIGDAIFVEGARPDIEIALPGYPMNYKAGWGYMMLTNMLPGQGNGIYKLYAYATDKEGNRVLLGTKTITCSNATAVKPFGTIDTPTQGGEASENAYLNWGWVLTPQTKTVPKDGSTILVYVDGAYVGNLGKLPNFYNAYRSDVSDAFPGLNNTGGPGAGGPVGLYYLDTTGYANGVHTIQWVATDDNGDADGIGSRYFNVLNLGAVASGRHHEERSDIDKIGDRDSFRVPNFSGRTMESILNLPISFDPLGVKRGFNLTAAPETIIPDNFGSLQIEMREVERIELDLGQETPYRGYVVVGDELRPLPIGSTLDQKTGTFSWLPGPGFIGSYDLVFITTDASGITKRIPVQVKIKPKFNK